MDLGKAEETRGYSLNTSAPFEKFVLNLHRRGYTPGEISGFWGGSKSKVYVVLKRFALKPNINDTTKICSKLCVGNTLPRWRRRYDSSFKYCPFCGKELHIRRSAKTIVDAHGEVMQWKNRK